MEDPLVNMGLKRSRLSSEEAGDAASFLMSLKEQAPSTTSLPPSKDIMGIGGAAGNPFYHLLSMSKLNPDIAKVPSPPPRQQRQGRPSHQTISLPKPSDSYVSLSSTDRDSKKQPFINKLYDMWHSPEVGHVVHKCVLCCHSYCHYDCCYITHANIHIHS